MLLFQEREVTSVGVSLGCVYLKSHYLTKETDLLLLSFSTQGGYLNAKKSKLNGSIDNSGLTADNSICFIPHHKMSSQRRGHLPQTTDETRLFLMFLELLYSVIDVSLRQRTAKCTCELCMRAAHDCPACQCLIRHWIPRYQWDDACTR